MLVMLDLVVMLTAEGFIQIYQDSSGSVSSATLPSLQTPVVSSPPPIKRLRMPCRQSHCAVLGQSQRELGFPWVGFSHLGPSSSSSWPTFRSGGPTLISRPRSVLHSKLIISFVYLSRHPGSNCRGLFSNQMLTLIQGLVDLWFIAVSSRLVVGPIEHAPLLFDLEGLPHPCSSIIKKPCFEPVSFVERLLFPLSSSRERTIVTSYHPQFAERSLPHSSFTERAFPPSSCTERSLSQPFFGLEKSKTQLYSCLECFDESSALMAKAKAVRAIFDHMLVLGLLKLGFIAESVQVTRVNPLDKSSSLYLFLSCILLFSHCKNSPLLRF